MKHKYYNIAIYSAIAAVLVFFIAFRFFNASIDRQMKAQIYEKEKAAIVEQLKTTRAQEAKETKGITDANALSPNTIRVQKQSLLLENQRYWDINTQATFDGTDVLKRMEHDGVFEGHQKTPEQFERQLKRLDGRIGEYEQRVQADPGDDEARKKLQSLYMLRATVGGLEGAVVKGQ